MRTTTRLLAAFLIAILAFGASTAYSQWVASRIDAAAHSISDDAISAIRALASARMQLRHLESLVARYVHQPSPSLRTRVESKQADVARALHAYLTLQIYPGERDLWSDVEETAQQYDHAVVAAMAEADVGALREAEALLSDEVARRADATVDAITRAIDFNAQAGQKLALEITSERRRTLVLAIVLDIASGALTLALAWMAIAAIGRHQRELAAERAQARQRAAELEQFAGRVAHDIRGPMTAVQLAFGTLESQIPSNETTTRLMALGGSALKRAETILSGLLEFARAGAQPAEGESTDVAALLYDVVTALRPLADAEHIDLRLVPVPARTVHANSGVLTSVVENLLRNAIRYMEGPRREIEVRAREQGPMLRVEVEDTGPGVPPELGARIFEPHVRGHADRKGIGLGLATVRKIVEAHGGRVGVQSIVGRGATFWFELPLIDERAAASQVLH